MLEFLENVRIARKGYNYLRKCQNYSKMLAFLENVRIAKNIRKATILRKSYNF